MIGIGNENIGEQTQNMLQRSHLEYPIIYQTNKQINK